MSVKLTDRAVRTRVKSCSLSLEVIHKRTAGFLFGNPTMGTGELKLRPLNDKCELVQPVQVRASWSSSVRVRMMSGAVRVTLLACVDESSSSDLGRRQVSGRPDGGGASAKSAERQEASGKNNHRGHSISVRGCRAARSRGRASDGFNTSACTNCCSHSHCLCYRSSPASICSGCPPRCGSSSGSDSSGRGSGRSVTSWHH
jgi:hypothetical protein